jgi:hypothetical protein
MAKDAGGLSYINAAKRAPMIRTPLSDSATVVTERWMCQPLGGEALEGIGL